MTNQEFIKDKIKGVIEKENIVYNTEIDLLINKILSIIEIRNALRVSKEILELKFLDDKKRAELLEYIKDWKIDLLNQDKNL